MVMDNEQVMARIEKQLEGNTLALSALAEILTKMDDKDEEEELEKAEAEKEEEEMEKQSALVKAIAASVYGMVKADQGLELDGAKVRSASSQGTGDDDSAKVVNTSTAGSDQQAVIQAAQYGAEDDEDDEEAVEKGGSEEYPMEEDEKEDEEVEKGYMGAMRKELDAMRKQIAAYETNMSKAIQTESEERLRKMGFREERGLVAPKQTGPSVAASLGLDGSAIVKGAENEGDVVETLIGLDYKTLRTLQTQIQNGQTDGIPRELLNG
tara:strand:- start:497 stop:1297 length:801 start_codon:yes stop_codon:yes gene_type:complete